MKTSDTTCPRCGHPNDPSAPLCGSCYADLRTASCPYCGAKHLPSAPVCPQCRRRLGAAAGGTAAVVVPPTEEPDPGGWKRTTDLLFLLWLLAYVAAMGMTSIFAFATPPHPLATRVFAVLGSGLGPLLFTLLLWFGWAGRLMPGWAPLLAGVCGAGIGVVFAGILYLIVPAVGLGFGSLLALPVIVGAAEELGKALSLGLFFKTKQYQPERCGLVLGMLAGLGFAAAENVGYAGRALMQHGVLELLPVLGMRVATSLAHAMWTGILCSVAWRERRGTFQFSPAVLNTYLGVSILHAVWDFGLVTRHESEALAAVMVSALVTLAVWLLRVRAAFRD